MSYIYNISEVVLYAKCNIILILLVSCTCKDLISANGYGNCAKLAPTYGNKAICYVNQPSNCGDLKNSGSNPGEKTSAEACTQSNNLLNINARIINDMINANRVN